MQDKNNLTYSLSGQADWIFGIGQYLPIPDVPDLIRIPINDSIIYVLVSTCEDEVIIQNTILNEVYKFTLGDYTNFNGTLVKFVLAKLKEGGWHSVYAFNKIRNWKKKFEIMNCEWEPMIPKGRS